MTSTKLTKTTLADAFEIGRREGLREAFEEIKKMVQYEPTKIYIEARLKSIHDFEAKNPFRRKD